MTYTIVFVFFYVVASISVAWRRGLHGARCTCVPKQCKEASEGCHILCENSGYKPVFSESSGRSRPLEQKEGSSKIYLTEDQYRKVSIQFVLPFLLIVVIDIICNIVCAGDGSMDGARAWCVLCLVSILGFRRLPESVSASQAMLRNQS